MNSHYTHIKTIQTPTFSLGMYETKYGYIIETEVLGKVVVSEEVKDFNMATFMFSIKLQELEGQ